MRENEFAREGLLAEVRWLRGLARELVADPSQRDDLVQATMVQALRAPPRSADRRSLRAWLRRVFENTNRSMHRTRERALDRERLAARPEAAELAAEPADETVARAELSRKLLELVLSLDSRSRDVLLLRYFRGLDTAQIAAKLLCSEEVVRQRQSRALAQLREKTRDDRDLRELVAVAGWLPRATNVLPRVVIGAACGSLAIVAACLGPELIAEPAGRPTLARVEAGSSGASESPAASASLETPGAREPSAAEATADWLALTIRDTRSGAPIAGATVARARAKDWDQVVADVEAGWDRHGISGSAGSFLELAREEATPAEPGTESTPPFAPKDESVLAVSGVDGAVRLTTELPRDEFLVVRAPGRGPRYLPVREVEWLAEKRVTVDLNPTGELPVHVHTLSGEDIEDAFLRVEAVPYLPEFRPQRFLPLVDGLAWRGPTSADGKCTLTDVPLDEAIVVTPLSRCIGKSADLLLQSGASTDPLDLVVAPPGGAIGRVVDERGQAVAGAYMTLWPDWGFRDRALPFTTDDTGAFRISRVPAGRHRLQCNPPRESTGPMLQVVEWPLVIEPLSTVDLGEFVVTGSAACTGRVLGLPPPELDQGGSYIEWIQDGRRERIYLGPTRRFEFLGRTGRGRIEMGVGVDWGSAEPLLSREVSLPCEGLELDITPHAGTLAFRVPPELPPIAGVHLYDRRRFRSDGTPKWEGAISRYEFAPVEGAYRIEALPPGAYRLELVTARGAQSYATELTLEPGKVCDLGRIEFGNGSIAGLLAEAPRESTARAVRRLPGMFGRGAFGDDHFEERTAPVEADGSFLFPDLPAGLWCVTARAGEFALSPGRVVDLRVGGDERVNLRASRAARVRCRVHRCGAPVIGASASWQFDDPDAMRPFFELAPSTTATLTGPDGIVQLGEFFPGRYQVDVELNGSRQWRRFDAGWGADVVLDFDFGQPEVEVRLTLPEEWAQRASRVTYLPTSERDGGSSPQQLLRRRGTREFLLRAAAGRGLLAVSLVREWQADEVWIPVEIRESSKSVAPEVGRGEIVVRCDGEIDGPPSLIPVTIAGHLVPESPLPASWPWEPQGPGVWRARGVPERSTFRLIRRDERNPVGRDMPTRRIEFESGRLEIEWP